MNKIGVIIKRQNMLTTLLLLMYGGGITIVLTVMVIRSEYYRQLYLEVAWDCYSLENIKCFFQRMNFVLTELYPVVDVLNKKRGRPATDRRFQLRFVIWWKLFGPQGQQTAVKDLNRSPTLQQILRAPETPYTRASLRRFLYDLGEERFQLIGVAIVKYLLKKKLLTLSKLVMDSFPVYSHLNPIKCYRSAPFDRHVARWIFKQLQLTNILPLFPKQHGRVTPLTDKLKAWIHHLLWDISSDATNHRLIFSKSNRKSVMGLEKGWKTVDTYRNFLKYVSRLSNRSQIESLLLEETTRILRVLELIPKTHHFQGLEDLRAVFHTPHRFNDRGISLHYCAAKDQHFFGRGGLLAVIPELELPLFIGLTPKYKQSERQIQDFIKKLAHQFQHELKNVTVIADSEFGTQTIKSMFHQVFWAMTHIDNYGKSIERYKYTLSQQRDLKTVERVIGRLTTYHQLERPIASGTTSVSIHLQLVLMSDLLVVCYNLLNGNRAHPHSLSAIRG
jgi:hypothetical protein